MNRHLNRFANLFVLLLCMLSLCALARDSFSLLLPDETFLWLALLCLLLWLATTFRRGVLIGLPLSALVLWYLYQERSFDLLTEMKDMLDRISSVYYGSYSTTNALITADGAAGNHMVGILFIFFVLAAFVAAALGSGSFRVSLTILGTLPVFALCIAVNGTPQIFPVLGYLLSLVGAQLGGDVFRLNDGAGKSLFLGIVPCLVVLAALLLLYNPKTYEPTEHDISLSQRFDKLGNRLAEWLSENDENGDNRQQPLSATAPAATVTATPAPKVHHAPSGWDQESDNLDLTASFDASALDDEAFRVTADTAGSLYFRGKNYGDYDGTSWSAAVENSRGSALSFVGQAIAGMSDTVSGEFQLKSSAATAAACADVGRTAGKGRTFISAADQYCGNRSKPMLTIGKKTSSLSRITLTPPTWKPYADSARLIRPIWKPCIESATLMMPTCTPRMERTSFQRPT